MDVKELFQLTRFEHALMLALAVLIGETIVLGMVPPINAVLALSLLVPIFSEMGSFALNDYLDIETDRLNRKMDRPLVRGTISKGFALWFSIACLAASVIFAFFININAFMIALVFGALAVAYNWKLKDLPIVGNVYIAFTMAIPFIFGDFVYADSLLPVALTLACLGFVAGLAREIIKSVQDMEGDLKARHSKTIPIVIGEGPSLVIASVLYLLFIPLSALPFLMGLPQKMPALMLVAIADALILGIVYRIFSQGAYACGFARKASLIAFFIGLIGLLVAVI